MGVTRLLLLGPFYTIQMQFYVLFCTRLYNGIFIQKVDSCSSTVFIFGQDSRKTVHDGREVFFILLLSSLSLYQKNMSAVSGEQKSLRNPTLEDE